jgi:hypothetical protein
LPGNWIGGIVGVEGEVAQTMYTHVSNCKNDKIKNEKKKKNSVPVMEG